MYIRSTEKDTLQGKKLSVVQVLEVYLTYAPKTLRIILRCYQYRYNMNSVVIKVA